MAALAAVLAAVLAAAPALAHSAQAQSAVGIRASAMVSNSVMNVRVQADTASLPTVPAPTIRRLVIAGVGVLAVQAGPEQAIGIARRTGADARPELVVQVFDVGS